MLIDRYTPEDVFAGQTDSVLRQLDQLLDGRRADRFSPLPYHRHGNANRKPQS